MLVAIALALLAPPAVADHVYSHRYVFEGRLIGGNGLPIPAAPVDFFAEGDTFVERCAEEPLHALTSELGDFTFCFHKHDLKPATIVGVTAGNATIRKPIDTTMRRTVVLLRDYDVDGVAPPAWNETFRVTGRAWHPGSTYLEGVHVFGLAVPNLPLNVTLTTAEGAVSYPVVTNAYGDFEATLRVRPDIALDDAVIRVEPPQGPATEEGLSTVFHRNIVALWLPPPAGFIAVDDRTSDPIGLATQTPPGTSEGSALGLVVFGLGLVAVIVLALRGRNR